MDLLDTYRDALRGSPGSNTCKGALPKFPMFCHLSIKNHMLVYLRYMENKAQHKQVSKEKHASSSVV